MAELVLHLDEDTARALACAAERDHVSEADWASEALKERLSAEDSPPGSIMQYYGAWEDDGRSIEEVMAELRPRGWRARDISFD
jgi:hypothetical protein